VLEAADIETDEQERRRLLTFVVAGGGFSGVECIAEMHDFVRRACRSYQTIRPEHCRFVLLQSGERILPEIAPQLAEFATEILRRRGIEIRLNTRLAAVSAEQAVFLEKGGPGPESAPSRTVVVTVPAAPHALLASLPCPLE
jgi:NADH dehydrogenase